MQEVSGVFQPASLVFLMKVRRKDENNQANWWLKVSFTASARPSMNPLIGHLSCVLMACLLTFHHRFQFLNCDKIHSIITYVTAPALVYPTTATVGTCLLCRWCLTCSRCFLITSSFFFSFRSRSVMILFCFSRSVSPDPPLVCVPPLCWS